MTGSAVPDSPVVVGGDVAPRVVLGAALTVLAAGIVAGILVPAGPGWDFANFYDTGRRALAGHLADIYHPTVAIGSEAPQGRMAFWSAPISAYLYVPMALLEPRAALVAFKIAGTLAYLCGLVLLAFEAVASRPAYRPTLRDAAWGAVLVTLFQPFWTIYRVGGQTTPFVFLLLVLGLIAHRRERIAATVACLVLASLIKPAFILVPALLGLLSGIRMIAALGAGFALVGLGSVLLLGWPIHAEFLQVLAKGASNPAPWFFNSSIYLLADVARPSAGSARLPDLMRIALQLLVIASLIGMVRVRSVAGLAGAARRRFDYLIAVGFALLLSRVVWEHYLAVLFIPLAFLIHWRDAIPSGARRLLYAIFVLALGQNLVLVMFVRSHVAISTTPELLLVTFIKAGPLFLYWVLMVAYGRVWAERLQAA